MGPHTPRHAVHNDADFMGDHLRSPSPARCGVGVLRCWVLGIEVDFPTPCSLLPSSFYLSNVAVCCGFAPSGSAGASAPALGREPSSSCRQCATSPAGP